MTPVVVTFKKEMSLNFQQNLYLSVWFYMQALNIFFYTPPHLSFTPFWIHLLRPCFMVHLASAPHYCSPRRARSTETLTC